MPADVLTMLTTASLVAVAAGIALVATLRDPEKRAKIVAPIASILTGGLVNNLSTVKAGVDALGSALESLAGTVVSQGASLKLAEERIEQLEDRLALREAKIAELSKQLTAARRELTTEKKQNKLLRGEIVELREELGRLGGLMGE